MEFGGSRPTAQATAVGGLTVLAARIRYGRALLAEVGLWLVIATEGVDAVVPDSWRPIRRREVGLEVVRGEGFQRTDPDRERLFAAAQYVMALEDLAGQLLDTVEGTQGPLAELVDGLEAIAVPLPDKLIGSHHALYEVRWILGRFLRVFCGVFDERPGCFAASALRNGVVALHDWAPEMTLNQVSRALVGSASIPAEELRFMGSSGWSWPEECTMPEALPAIRWVRFYQRTPSGYTAPDSSIAAHYTWLADIFEQWAAWLRDDADTVATDDPHYPDVARLHAAAAHADWLHDQLAKSALAYRPTWELTDDWQGAWKTSMPSLPEPVARFYPGIGRIRHELIEELFVARDRMFPTFDGRTWSDYGRSRPGHQSDLLAGWVSSCPDDPDETDRW